MNRPITANMRIEEVLERYPQTLLVFHRYGLSCGDCHVSRYESIGQGAQVHALDILTLLDELNLAATRPLRQRPGLNVVP